MANTRKVLINRHTSGSSAPQADSMYLGEIAVAHETGKETLFTKNNAGNMVPFISCAQTITMINNAISAADVTYEVKAAENDAHVEVTPGGSESAKIFTVASKDVMSEGEFKAYSAQTKTRIDNIADAVDTLTDVVVTGITGDSIITATLVDPNTGNNAYNITHKSGHESTGFNKLATDAYGHVTASTAVSTSDIEALGFKTSAETKADLEALSASVVTNKTNIEALSAGTQHDIEALSGNVVEYVKVVSGNIETVINSLSAGTLQLSADTHNKIVSVYNSATTYANDAIAAAIEGLDSNSATTDSRHYVTAITIENGKITSFGEGTDPQLSVESAGTGNVVSQITVADHKISYTTTSVATSEDIQKLSAATIALSAGTIQISADTVAYVNAVSGNIESVINAMDKDADAVAGQVVTTVAQEDGKVTETKANVKDLQLGGYSKDTAATGPIAGTDTINTALSKLENQVGANKITNGDSSITVTEPAGTATTTDIKVNIKSGEKVIKLDGNGGGLYTNLNLVKITESLPATVKERYEFRDSDNNKIGESIDIAKDSHIVSITYDEATQKLIYTYLDASGATQTTEVDMAHLILETEVENGIQSVNGKLSIKLDTTGDDTGDGKFLTVGADGLKLDGVTDAINAAIDSLDVTGDTAVAGQYVAAIQEADGIVSVKTRANVSEAVLTNYAKGSDATAVAATDTVNGAISKLENQIDKAKAAATTKVVEGTDAGNNMTIASTTSETDGSVTYTINLTDVASKAALDAEIAARKAVDGQNGDTYAANANTNFISDATSLNDADIKLDATIKTLSGNAHDAMIARDNAVFSSAVTYVNEQIDEVYASGVSYTNAKVAAEIALLDSSSAATDSGHYITAITITDGKISAVADAAIPANVAVTTAAGTTGETAVAVLAGITPGGTDGHELTLNYSNKVFSATTAESALTSESAITSLSAQTSVSASMAYELSSAATISSGQVRDLENVIKNIKVNSAITAESADTAAKVAKALSVSGYATSESDSLDSAVNYDGSAAQSITFGKDTAAGKSMSFNGGVVDVEIIDCGTY